MFLMNTYPRKDIAFVRGENSVLFDKNGKRYIDFLSGIAVNTLGYSHQKLKNALKNQIDEIIHISNLYENPWQEEVASKLISFYKDKGKVFFCNSGTEANEAAIKLTRKYFKDKGKDKYRIITFKGGFHGRTMGSLSATPRPNLHQGFEPMLEGFDYAEFNDINSVKSLMTDKTAGIMIEAIQGEGGINEANLDFLKELEILCKENDMLLILDEVQAGMGRTGKFFAYQYADIKPDIVTMAKGLGSGLPIGAVIAKDEISESFGVGTHGATFGGNALSCIAASITLDEIPNLMKDIPSKEAIFRNALEGFGLLKGKGLMLGLDIKKDCKEISNELHKRGLVINCTANSVLRMLPPLVITKEEIEEGLDILTSTLKDLL
jgi:predicted acetylornithine/succinylornithine family transaminase